MLNKEELLLNNTKNEYNKLKVLFEDKEINYIY